MTPRKARISLNLLGRHPEPGQCKTRLIPALGIEGATEAHAALLTHTTCTMRRWCDVCATERRFRLWTTTKSRTPFLSSLVEPDQLRLQPEGDLGARLAWIAQAGLAEAEVVLLVGGDAVSLDEKSLDHTETLLSSHDAILVPAEDGGYVLMGLRRLDPALFAAMPWGGERLAEATRAVFRQLGWSWAEIPGHWDVDFPEEWERFRSLAKNWSDNCSYAIVSGGG
ncbi:MAG: TIGR04282 family arsenosugar biosynthesis glycosyltransferase [Magnetococcus sp. YQC-9]